MDFFRNNQLLGGAILGFLLGFLLLFGLHVLRAEHHGVHYHANFALFINGERNDFDNFTYYEEIQACQPENGISPQSRVHMHDFINDVVHVHAEGATWGHFFANLGYGLSNNTVITRDGVFQNGVDGTLTFVLNGQTTRSIANEIIQDGDVLLINFGDEDSDEIRSRFDDIPRTADIFNEKDDPSSCAGEHKTTIFDRMRRAITL